MLLTRATWQRRRLDLQLLSCPIYCKNWLFLTKMGLWLVISVPVTITGEDTGFVRTPLFQKKINKKIGSEVFMLRRFLNSLSQCSLTAACQQTPRNTFTCSTFPKACLEVQSFAKGNFVMTQRETFLTNEFGVSGSTVQLGDLFFIFLFFFFTLWDTCRLCLPPLQTCCSTMKHGAKSREAVNRRRNMPFSGKQQRFLNN